MSVCVCTCVCTYTHKRPRLFARERPVGFAVRQRKASLAPNLRRNNEERKSRCSARRRRSQLKSGTRDRSADEGNGKPARCRRQTSGAGLEGKQERVLKRGGSSCESLRGGETRSPGWAPPLAFRSARARAVGGRGGAEASCLALQLIHWGENAHAYKQVASLGGGVK